MEDIMSTTSTRKQTPQRQRRRRRRRRKHGYLPKASKGLLHRCLIGVLLLFLHGGNVLLLSKRCCHYSFCLAFTSLSTPGRRSVGRQLALPTFSKGQQQRNVVSTTLTTTRTTTMTTTTTATCRRDGGRGMKLWGSTSSNDEDEGEGKKKKKKKGTDEGGSSTRSRKKKSTAKDKTQRQQQPQGKKKQGKNKKQQAAATGGKKKPIESKKKKKKQQQDNNNKQKSPPKKGPDSTKSKKKKDSSKNKNILSLIDPFQAGVKFRQTLDNAITTLSKPQLDAQRRSIYYLDDRFLEPNSNPAPIFAERNPIFDRLTYNPDYNPEVLVVGATGSVGRLVVRRLVLDGRYKVRVLVRDLYSKTLNLLGTGVTYCQGDLLNVESLEYAVTDVDKIVFCAGAPRPGDDDGDEEDGTNKSGGFRERFMDLVEEMNLKDNEDDEGKGESIKKPPSSLSQSQGNDNANDSNDDDDDDDLNWQRLDSIMELRSKLAEQIDCIGLGNLVRAYQNVRHADYGTSQAAKRSLFKFRSREEDFNLFMIDLDDDDEEEEEEVDQDGYGSADDVYAEPNKGQKKQNSYADNSYYDQDDDAYSDYEEDDEDAMYEKYAKETSSYYDDKYSNIQLPKRGSGSSSSTNIIQPTQVSWIKNKFNHGVFVGRVPTTSSTSSTSTEGGGGEASVISTRLRSRTDPQCGIDLLSNGFAGFVIRLCSDGGTYECFVRTGEYETRGVEYVCEFGTKSKRRQYYGGKGNMNKSRNKFVTVRLPFSEFVPKKRRKAGKVLASASTAAAATAAVGSDTGVVDMTTPTTPASGDEAQEESSIDLSTLTFTGADVRQLGFRYKASSNTKRQSTSSSPSYRNNNNNNVNNIGGGGNGGWSKFYLAIDYIKVFRSQLEPEFIYLSDARIPPLVKDGMVRHDMKRIVPLEEEEEDTFCIIDDYGEVSKKVLCDVNDRSEEEVYWKLRGEEILRNSGLSYSIVRVAGYDESPSGAIKLQKTNNEVTFVSRNDVAQFCANALLDPNALNECYYLSKQTSSKRK